MILHFGKSTGIYPTFFGTQPNLCHIYYQIGHLFQLMYNILYLFSTLPEILWVFRFFPKIDNLNENYFIISFNTNLAFNSSYEESKQKPLLRLFSLRRNKKRWVSWLCRTNRKITTNAVSDDMKFDIMLEFKKKPT